MFWLKLEKMLYNATSSMIMMVLFFCFITPIGLVMRLLGKDLLRLHCAPSIQSYWQKRGDNHPIDMTKQY